jgi:hypothetical protein
MAKWVLRCDRKEKRLKSLNGSWEEDVGPLGQLAGDDVFEFQKVGIYTKIFLGNLSLKLCKC